MPHPAEQIRFCTSRDGTRIAYAVSGAGPPLVWLQTWVHHLRFDWDSPLWRSWLSLLAQRHTLVRYDFRGLGLSDRDGVQFSLERHVEDLEAVTDAAGLECFALFGMGGGGAKASAYAVRHPQRVGRLVLYAPPTRGRLVGAVDQRRLEEADTRLKAIELGWMGDIPAYRHFLASLQIPDAPAEQIQSFNDLLHRAASPANALALLRAYWQVDVVDVLPKIACPTLVLHAREDSTIPFEQGRKLAAMVPGAQFVPLESRNHILVESEPAWRQLVDALNNFLPGVPAQAVASSRAFLDGLTAREHEVLELLAQGLDNDTIAGRLGISEKTVRNQVSAIFSKLDVNSRAQAVVRARDAGFGRRTAG
jgi:pimeloyl-ACP methyl ester carboxylesterase/DNA-binding CsgD family transcriptional regulator